MPVWMSGIWMSGRLFVLMKLPANELSDGIILSPLPVPTASPSPKTTALPGPIVSFIIRLPSKEEGGQRVFFDLFVREQKDS